MTDQNSEGSFIKSLAEEFAGRWRRGESPSVEEYVAKHPEWAGIIQKQFPAIAEREQRDRLQERSDMLPASPDSFRLERLGDFRILEEIGRGGMGEKRAVAQLRLPGSAGTRGAGRAEGRPEASAAARRP